MKLKAGNQQRKLIKPKAGLWNDPYFDTPVAKPTMRKRERTQIIISEMKEGT